jgi:hypothetical protein
MTENSKPTKKDTEKRPPVSAEPRCPVRGGYVDENHKHAQKDATFSSLVNHTISYLRDASEQAASFDAIRVHLQRKIRILNISAEHLDHWGRYVVVRDGTVHRILGRLEDAMILERVREGRGVVYALTDERKWQEPSW